MRKVEGQHWSLLPLRATGPKGTAWSYGRGKVRLGARNVLHQKVRGMKQIPRGRGHGTELLEFKECLDNAPRYRH